MAVVNVSVASMAFPVVTVVRSIGRLWHGRDITTVHTSASWQTLREARRQVMGLVCIQAMLRPKVRISHDSANHQISL